MLKQTTSLKQQQQQHDNNRARWSDSRVGSCCGRPMDCASRGGALGGDDEHVGLESVEELDT
jgi:hypothetical protein